MADTEKRPRFGLYRAGISSAERLDFTTVGREEMVTDLVEKLSRSSKKKTHQHYLFVGPRGVGKTHFLSLLVHRLEEAVETAEQFTIVRFPEEISRLLSFADFLLRVCEGLTEIDGHEEWQTLFDELAEEEDDDKVADSLEPMLDAYRKQHNRTLLILVENLNEILTRQIKDKQDIHRMRRFLMNTPSCILVATSPVMFAGVIDVAEPFYDFFDVQVIESLTSQQTIDTIKLNLEFDGKSELIQRFNELVPKIKALHDMTGGNPRLVMMHYALIAERNILEVKDQFEELLDRISPFYQDRLNDLSPQERAVLETMALMRTEQKTPIKISKKLRKSAQQTSSLLKRLTGAGYVTVADNPDDRRSKVYRIREGFFDLWLSMNESRKQRVRLPALAQFLEWWYTREEREHQRESSLNELLEKSDASLDDLNCFALLDFLSEAGESDEKATAKIKLASVLQSLGKGEKADAYLAEAHAMRLDGVMEWITTHGHIWSEADVPIDPISTTQNLIECWKLERSGDLEEFGKRVVQIGTELQGAGLHRARADLLSDSIDRLPEGNPRLRAAIDAADSLLAIGELEEAIQILSSAVVSVGDEVIESDTFIQVLTQLGNVYQLTSSFDEAESTLQRALKLSVNLPRNEAIVLNGLAGIALKRGNYDTALDYLRNALSSSKQSKDKAVGCRVLDNMALIHEKKGDLDTATKLLHESLKIRKELGDRSGEAQTLNSIGRVHVMRGDFSTAQKVLEESLVIQRELGERVGEAVTLSLLGHAFESRGDFRIASQYCERSLEIQKEIGNRRGELLAWLRLGAGQSNSGRLDDAQASLKQAIKLSQEIGDRRQEAIILHGLAEIELEKRMYGKAADLFQKSLSISETIGDLSFEATTWCQLGRGLYLEGRYEEAREPLERSLKIQQSIEDRVGETTVLRAIGENEFAMGRSDVARKYLLEALELSQQIGGQREEAKILLTLTQFDTSEREIGNGAERIIRAFRIIRSSDDRELEAIAWYRFGMLAENAGRQELAIEGLMLYALLELSIAGGDANSTQFIGAINVAVGVANKAGINLTEALEDKLKQARIKFSEDRGESLLTALSDLAEESRS